MGASKENADLHAVLRVACSKLSRLEMEREGGGRGGAHTEHLQVSEQLQAKIVEMTTEICTEVSTHVAVASTQEAMSSMKDAFLELETTVRQGLMELSQDVGLKIETIACETSASMDEKEQALRTLVHRWGASLTNELFKATQCVDEKLEREAKSLQQLVDNASASLREEISELKNACVRSTSS